jgi:alkyl hydroperoxide reductase subunit D
MELEQLLNHVPDYAKDLKLNRAASRASLNSPSARPGHRGRLRRRRAQSAAAGALAEAATHLDEQAIRWAASAIMGMNNISTASVTRAATKAAPAARLRMQVIGRHGSDPVDFELWCRRVGDQRLRSLRDAHEKYCARRV